MTANASGSGGGDRVCQRRQILLDEHDFTIATRDGAAHQVEQTTLAFVPDHGRRVVGRRWQIPGERRRVGTLGVIGGKPDARFLVERVDQRHLAGLVAFAERLLERGQLGRRRPWNQAADELDRSSNLVEHRAAEDGVRRLFDEVHLEQALQFRLRRQVAQVVGNRAVPRRRRADALGIERRKRGFGLRQRGGDVARRVARRQPRGQRPRRLGAGDHEPEVRHEDLRVNEIGNELLGLCDRHVRIDERGNEIRRRGALRGSCQRARELGRRLCRDEAIGPLLARQTGFHVAHVPGALIQAGVRLQREAGAADRVLRQRVRECEQVVHVEARVPEAPLPRVEDQIGGVAEASDGRAGEESKRRRASGRAREVLYERALRALAAIAFGICNPDCDRLVKIRRRHEDRVAELSRRNEIPKAISLRLPIGLQRGVEGVVVHPRGLQIGAPREEGVERQQRRPEVEAGGRREAARRSAHCASTARPSASVARSTRYCSSSASSGPFSTARHNASTWRGVSGEHSTPFT